MPNFSSNEFWRSATNYQSFELRAHRFREEMLPVFYAWLGITEDSDVLDGGCGSGVFTRYLAKGLRGGHITGFDINKIFIEFGTEKAVELGLADRMTLEVADGFHLPYADARFDAVTNYTYIGVLSDRRAGLEELIRVCRPGGTVSCVVASYTTIGFQGGYPFEGAGRLQELARAEWDIFKNMRGSADDAQISELLLMKECGLKEIHIYPFSHLICYCDTNFPAEYRKTLAIEETKDESQWLKSRYRENIGVYAQRGFSSEDYHELMGLMEKKLEYLIHNFETDESYEWHGGLNFIVTGKKA